MVGVVKWMVLSVWSKVTDSFWAFRNASGQGRFSTIIKSYSRGVQGILLVYDITNRWSFNGIRRWLAEIDEVSVKNFDLYRLNSVFSINEIHEIRTNLIRSLFILKWVSSRLLIWKSLKKSSSSQMLISLYAPVSFNSSMSKIFFEISLLHVFCVWCLFTACTWCSENFNWQ